MKAEVITGNYAGASRRIKSYQNVHGSETGIYGSNCPQWIIAMEALLQALGERKGINRFGDFSPPLDEALIHVSLIIDLCNVREDVRRKAISIIDKFAERGLRSLDVGKQECQKKARRVQETRGSLSAYCLSLILQGMTVQKPLDGHSISE